MICCVVSLLACYVFLLLCSPSLHLVIYDHTNCSVQECLTCSNAKINCSLTPLNSGYTLYNLYCLAPPECVVKPVSFLSESDKHYCLISITKTANVGWLIIAGEQVYNDQADSCEMVGTDKRQLHLNCLDLHYEAATREDIGSTLIYCDYYNSTCQRAINITVVVTNETNTYSDFNSSVTNPYFHLSHCASSSVNSFSASTTLKNSFSVSTTLNYSQSPSTSPTTTSELTSTSIFVVIGFLVVLFFILMFALSIIIYFKFCKNSSLRANKPSNPTIGRQHSHQITFHPERSPTIEVEDQDTSEELPMTLVLTIANGKFGSVWEAVYNEKTVAVKIFNLHSKSSWENEVNINTLGSTPHENILQYINSGSSGTGYHKQFFIITQYCPLGSLNQFLRHNVLSWEQALNMMYSVSRGLSHLHSTNYYKSNGLVLEKYAVAHRDIKTSNILLKDESGQCLIGDMKLALILDPLLDDKKLAKSGQVGTYRYMAPEALESRINLRDIESFKQIDVYALAFVLWEVCTRCKFDDEVSIQPYQPPLFDVVGERPTLEQMHEAVVAAKHRPPLLESWDYDENMLVLANLMVESWDEDPEGRLTAANITDRLEKLSNDRNIPKVVKHKKAYVSSSFSGPSCSTSGSSKLPLRYSVGNADNINLPLLSIQELRNRYKNEFAIPSNLSAESGVFDSESNS